MSKLQKIVSALTLGLLPDLQSAIEKEYDITIANETTERLEGITQEYLRSHIPEALLLAVTPKPVEVHIEPIFLTKPKPIKHFVPKNIGNKKSFTPKNNPIRYNRRG